MGIVAFFNAHPRNSAVVQLSGDQDVLALNR
jgi:hypothetical protein